MPSRRRGGKRGAAQASQDHNDENVNSNEQSSNEEAPATENEEQQQQQEQLPAAPPMTLDEASLSVLQDEEDSYRVVWEHDEHLARIRAYTDFFDQLAVMTKAASRAHGHRAGPAAGGGQSPMPLAPSPDRTPTDVGDFAIHSESAGLLSPFTSVDREVLMASAAPPGTYPATSWGAFSASDTMSPTAAADAHLISRLEAEKLRLAQELQASRHTIQQLQTSLQEARGAAEVVVPQEGEKAASNAPQTHRRLASPSSVSSLTNSASRPHSSTPSPSSEISPESAMAPAAAAAAVDDFDRRRSETQQFAPPPPPPASSLLAQPSQPSSHTQTATTSPPRHARRASPSPSRSAAPPRPIDVSEFFWSLHVAPPPAALHEQCGYPEHCQAAALRSPQEGGNGGSYGSTAVAVPAATREEEAALACESAWVDSSFYCYNIMEEMSSLRVVRSLEDVVDEDAGSKPLTLMTEDEVTRLLLDRTPATGRSPASSPVPQSLPFLASPVPPNGSGYGMAWPATAPLHPYGGSSAQEAAMLFDGSPVTSHATPGVSQRYRLPYLQRLWMTSVLRQYLLFLLLTIACVLLLIPGMMLGTVNVFEAADGDDFYVTRNRFGRSALLVVARLGACCLVFLLFFVYVYAEGGRRHAAKLVSRTSSLDRMVTPPSPPPPTETAAVESANSLSSNHHKNNTNNGSIPASTNSPTRTVGGASRLHPLGTLVHFVLCLGAGLLFAGSFLFYRGCTGRSLPMAVVGMALYGAGEALLLGGVGTVISAEVGVAAGVNVSLQILLSNWLLVNAFGSFVFPKLSYYVYSPSQLLRSQVYTTGIIAAFVFGLVMLSPRDLIERAGQAHAKFLSPRKLLSAARHDVSLCFYLRAVTVGLLTAAVMLMLVAGAAVFVPSQAEAASMAESTKSKELMSTNTGKRSGGTAGEGVPDAAVIAGSVDRWSSQQRHATVYLFAFALLLVPLCFIPRLAAVINRWCPVALMTTLLCLLWSVSTATSWATALGVNAAAPNSSSSAAGKKSERLWEWWIWTGRHHLFTPSMLVCGVVTGVIYTIVVSSLLRSIANAGVQLPVSHPARWRMAFHERDRRRVRKTTTTTTTPSASPSSSSLTPATEASPLLPTAVEDAYADERMRAVRMQLRGGPAVMTVLVALLIMILLITSVTVITVAAALLTDRDENPVYVNAVMPGVTWDQHLLVKTVVTSVFALAMLVQWVEVFHRFCCSCCC